VNDWACAGAETSKAQILEKNDDSGTSGLLHNLSGNCSGQAALKRELMGAVAD
jgi:hypothetical protein